MREIFNNNEFDFDLDDCIEPNLANINHKMHL